MQTDTKARRDQITGRYAHRNLALICRCGHTLGQHAATTVASQRDCFAESLDPKVGGCACERFRKAAVQPSEPCPNCDAASEEGRFCREHRFEPPAGR